MSGYDRSRIVGLSQNDLDEFTCGICQDILNGPVVTQCCRQIYCKTCIDEWLTKQNTCPNDRKSMQSSQLIPPPRLVLNLLNNMRIKCEYEANGCQVVTTIEQLAKHLEECEHKPNSSCKTCGLLKVEGEIHNCITNLVIRNRSIEDELNRLNGENQRLKQLLEKSTLGMAAVLESAKYAVNRSVVEKTRGITELQTKYLVNKTKEAVSLKDSFWSICEYLNSELNKSDLVRLNKRWQAVAFSIDGGESAANCEQLFRIRFDNLVIKLFTTRDLTAH